MRLIIIAMALGLAFYACDSFDGSGDDDTKLFKELTILDTLGNQKSSFMSGEEFQLRFTLTNQTRRDLTYHFTGFPVVFHVVQGDSVIATSTDGYIFPQVVLTGTLYRDSTIIYTWRAPNTPARESKIVLPPGQYTGRVLHGSFFVQFKAPNTDDVVFSVRR
jgi:hypothetical protein